MGIDWQPLLDIVRDNESFVLTSHMRPDCDALGSELAMAGALRALGKKVQIINGDAVPPHITFIDPEAEIKVLGEEVTIAEATASDVLMILDTSAWAQLGPMEDVVRATSAQKCLVDHHLSEDDLGTTNFKDTSSEATGRLVLEFCEAAGVTITPTMANAMFVAIATDTGWFRFSSVSEKTFAAGAKLIELGVRPDHLFGLLYERSSMERLHLHGRVQANASSYVDGKLMVSRIRQQDLEETGARASDSEDVVNRLLTVAGVEAAVLLLEISSERTKGSLRSRGELDVRSIAEKFGGGGHLAAAGVRYPGPLAEAEREIVAALQHAMNS